MAHRTERTVLNSLIETCRDSERGFRDASNLVQDPALKSFFVDMADRRARCAAELVPHAERLGGTETGKGSTAAALHRRWMDVKSVLTRHDDDSVVVEVLRGDEATLKAFEDAVEGMLPPDTRDLVEALYADLRHAHADIVEKERHAQ